MFPHLEYLKDGKLDKEEFIKCLKLAWEAITTDLITKLINLLPRRKEAVRPARGWNTKY